MSCEECADLTTHQFRSAADLVHAVQTAAGEMERGVLRRVEAAQLTDAEREAMQSVFDAGAQTTLLYRFQCTVCGDQFELAGDAESGNGGWTRLEPVVTPSSDAP